jgi:hypothetical protein
MADAIWSVDWHLERGLGVIFAEDTYATGNNLVTNREYWVYPYNSDLLTTLKLAPSREWGNLCNEYNAWKGLGNQD